MVRHFKGTAAIVLLFIVLLFIVLLFFVLLCYYIIAVLIFTVIVGVLCIIVVKVVCVAWDLETAFETKKIEKILYSLPLQISCY